MTMIRTYEPPERGPCPAPEMPKVDHHPDICHSTEPHHHHYSPRSSDIINWWGSECRHVASVHIAVLLTDGTTERFVVEPSVDGFPLRDFRLAQEYDPNHLTDVVNLGIGHARLKDVTK